MGEFSLFDLRVIVDRIEGRSVCGLAVGDYFEVTESSRIRIPADRHFCIYALSAILPLLPAVQRRLADGDWLERDTLVACHDLGAEVALRATAGGLITPARLVVMPTRLHRREQQRMKRVAWRAACRAGALPGLDRVLPRAATLVFRPSVG